MTKTQKIIIGFAAFLIIASILYLPYYRIEKGTYAKWARVLYSGWDWLYNLPSAHSEEGFYVITKIRFDLLSVEIFGILVVAAALYLITRKSGRIK